MGEYYFGYPTIYSCGVVYDYEKEGQEVLEILSCYINPFFTSPEGFIDVIDRDKFHNAGQYLLWKAFRLNILLNDPSHICKIKELMVGRKFFQFQKTSEIKVVEVVDIYYDGDIPMFVIKSHRENGRKESKSLRDYGVFPYGANKIGRYFWNGWNMLIPVEDFESDIVYAWPYTYNGKNA